MESWFISDIHLKSINERNGEILLRFLHFLNEKKDKKNISLFLLGDIFDFWVSSHKVFEIQYGAIIDQIHRLVLDGASVYYFEGNHDLHLDVFWQKKIGVQVFEDQKYFNLDGLTIRCEHGDLANQEDLAYQRLRKFVRHPIVETLGHQLPGQFWNWFGNKMSHTSAKGSRIYRDGHESFLKKMLHQYTELKYQEKPFDYIITGHLHIQDEYKIKNSNSKSVSINLGSWLGDKVFALKITQGGYEWIELR